MSTSGSLSYALDDLITIAIPTYNRCDVVARNVRSYMESEACEKCALLVIDNASEDDTYQSLVELVGEAENIKVLRNANNIGYAGNVIRLFREVTSKYVLITSDEDFLLIEGLAGLIGFLKASDFSFVSPQFFLEQEGEHKLYRGRRDRSEILPEQIKGASTYLSGLVFNVEHVQPHLDYLESLLDENEFAFLYPQVVLAILLSSAGRGRWYDQPVTCKKFQIESHITSKKGEKYYHLESRWRQFKSYDVLMDGLIECETNAKNVSFYRRVKKRNLEGLYKIINNAIAHEGDIYLKHYGEGVKKQFDKNHLRLCFQRFLGFKRSK